MAAPTPSVPAATPNPRATISPTGFLAISETSSDSGTPG